MTTVEQRDRDALPAISILPPPRPQESADSTYRLALAVFDGLSYQDTLRGVEALTALVQRPGRVTRLGAMWSGQSRLTSLLEAFRLGWVASQDARGAFGVLLGEAFGEVSQARVDELRRPHEYGYTCKYEDELPAKGASCPEIFGAYVLSAGLLAQTVDDVPPTSSFGWREREAGPLAILHVAEFGDLAALADMIAVWRADLLLAIQRWLSPAAYEYVDHGPPLACSPCGVIRMASPEVPRGPELGLQLDASSPFWALAA
ncbi:hypothetical protein AB0O18_30690 [Streptomyces sp. NPDC093224]|uniref:hypothetical protein n=1 Tax=Streptomyces sp. NPDC093224 TaxID=3155198 RepID=UPI00344906F5